MSAVRQFGGLIVSLLFFQYYVIAQGRTSNWIFGNGIHINYEDNIPYILPVVNSYVAREGAACISDIEGELLFYSNTIRVWNANFQPLLNSDTLPALATPPSSSKTNGSLFLPWPGDSSDQYFAFLQMNDLDNRLYCSKIDRLLDGGLGAVLDDFKNIAVWDHNVCEQLLAIKHANGRDWWIVSRMGYLTSSQMCVSLLTPDSLLNQGIQSAGFEGAYAGEMTASLDGSMIAIAAYDGTCFPHPPIIGLYNFDRCSGTITIKDTMFTRECYIACYGLAFAPSGNKLYYSTDGRISLYQIDTRDMELKDSLVFRLAGPSVFLMGSGQLELNSNGEIIMSYRKGNPTSGSDFLAQHLAVVRFPELDGLSCAVDTFGIFLDGFQNTHFSLPNFANYDLGPLVGSPCDTLSPPQDTIQTGLYHHPMPIWSIHPTVGAGTYTIVSPEAGLLVVYDLYGREVLRQLHEERTTFDLTAQPAGIYLVYMRAADGSQSLPRKIVRH